MILWVTEHSWSGRKDGDPHTSAPLEKYFHETPQCSEWRFELRALLQNVLFWIWRLSPSFLLIQCNSGPYSSFKHSWMGVFFKPFCIIEQSWNQHLWLIFFCKPLTCEKCHVFCFRLVTLSQLRSWGKLLIWSSTTQRVSSPVLPRGPRKSCPSLV